MIKAILQDGHIVPTEPLPPDWRDGAELSVDLRDESPPTSEELDRWARELHALCADSDPEEEARLDDFLNQRRQQEKALMRRRMGLPE
jgi:hypothetical protein